MNLAIDCQGLSKRFGAYTAVQGVTFQIPYGAIMGFVGPNGAGKTTTIRMVCGVLVPTDGKATVLGYDVKSQPEEIKQRIGYMSQKFSLYDDLTVKENLDFYAGVYNLRGKEAAAQKDRVIERIGLRERTSQLVSSLSGGWKQRVALACALLHNPQLLVLDEPTAGVDPVSRRIFWDIIRQLAHEGMTILVSTHYMDEAASCDYLGFVFYGRLIAFGSPEEMKEREGKDSLDDLFIYYVEHEASEDPRNIAARKGGEG
ncbi:ABC-type multidrug transport system, ATPase component [Desulfosporosinus acidiphilus SJ4]|uniref:ABC-type multidrug transport system, ATPase component n=1 Tax=Desulfosporosinus acidiphilus (strain DSM 22704 / JCM 16185 / SJ4) TaxID=646529 RepID=I4D200_DESAJ|nr:ABC transporter ATP-binding protein [Desulfosporosinus acidiphilus]AFM39824.1 ABC-type multidrug transport system, ATPase component [Desulfosporosinus acidiphilus SJ4]